MKRNVVTYMYVSVFRRAYRNLKMKANSGLITYVFRITILSQFK